MYTHTHTHTHTHTITKTLSRTYYRDVLLVDAAVHVLARSDADRDSYTSGGRPAERVSTTK